MGGAAGRGQHGEGTQSLGMGVPKWGCSVGSTSRNGELAHPRPAAAAASRAPKASGQGMGAHGDKAGDRHRGGAVPGSRGAARGRRAQPAAAAPAGPARRRRCRPPPAAPPAACSGWARPCWGRIPAPCRSSAGTPAPSGSGRRRGWAAPGLGCARRWAAAAGRSGAVRAGGAGSDPPDPLPIPTWWSARHISSVGFFISSRISCCRRRSSRRRWASSPLSTLRGPLPFFSLGRPFSLPFSALPFFSLAWRQTPGWGGGWVVPPAPSLPAPWLLRTHLGFLLGLLRFGSFRLLLLLVLGLGGDDKSSSWTDSNAGTHRSGQGAALCPPPQGKAPRQPPGRSAPRAAPSPPQAPLLPSASSSS